VGEKQATVNFIERVKSLILLQTDNIIILYSMFGTEVR